MGCNSIPIARSINHDDSTGLTRLTYLYSARKWTVLDPSWPQRVGSAEDKVFKLRGRLPSARTIRLQQLHPLL
jgi:hypothetical protein